MKKKTLTRGAVLVTLLLLIGLTVGSNYMVQYSLSPDNRGKDLKGSIEYMKQTYSHIVPWMDSITAGGALKDTCITAPDGIRLHAYYLEAAQPSPKTALIIHGYTDNAIRMFHIGYMYHHNLGYNILLPDLRYTGLSEGDAIQMGWLDRLDVRLWMDVATDIFGDSISGVIHGISMGAATTMMVSGEKTPEWIKCFVEDCGYTSVWDQFGKELKEQFGLPVFPLMYTSSLMCRWRHGWWFGEASSINQIKKCTKPILFIHGDEDDFVPTWMVYKLYEAKTAPKELWLTQGVKHAGSYRTYPKEYTQRVKQFTTQYIN